MMPRLSGWDVCRELRRRGHRRAGDHAHGARRGGRPRARASSWAPTTTSPSRSRCASCWRACARCCAGPDRAAKFEELAFGDVRVARAGPPRVRGPAARSGLTRKEFDLLVYLVEHQRRGRHARAAARRGVGLRALSHHAHRRHPRPEVAAQVRGRSRPAAPSS